MDKSLLLQMLFFSIVASTTQRHVSSEDQQHNKLENDLNFKKHVQPSDRFVTRTQTVVRHPSNHKFDLPPIPRSVDISNPTAFRDDLDLLKQLLPHSLWYTTTAMYGNVALSKYTDALTGISVNTDDDDDDFDPTIDHRRFKLATSRSDYHHHYHPSNPSTLREEYGNNHHQNVDQDYDMTYVEDYNVKAKNRTFVRKECSHSGDDKCVNAAASLSPPSIVAVMSIVMPMLHVQLLKSGKSPFF